MTERKCVQRKNVFGYPIEECDGNIEFHVYAEDADKLADCHQVGDKECCSHHVPLYAPTEERGEGEISGTSAFLRRSGWNPAPTPSPESPAARLRREAHAALDREFDHLHDYDGPEPDCCWQASWDADDARAAATEAILAAARKEAPNE